MTRTSSHRKNLQKAAGRCDAQRRAMVEYISELRTEPERKCSHSRLRRTGIRYRADEYREMAVLIETGNESCL